MRLPNGFGTVYKLSGNRRNPWIVRKTIGWDDDGKQIYYTIGYFETRAKGMAALVKYNENPIGKRGDVTLSDIYNEWSKSKYEKVSKSTVETYSAAWKHLSTLGQYKIKDVKKSHIQNVIDKMDQNKMSWSSCHKVKTLAGLLFKHALADDIVDKNYAELVELPAKEEKKKLIFTDLEIKQIEDFANDDEWINTILILIYTGMRIGELLTLTKFNVDIENMVIIGGIKTDSGKNRIIPIHHKIQRYVKMWYELDGEYLITRDGKRINIRYYRDNLYYPALEKYNMRKLTPHSTRHTFASLMARAGADTVSTQKIIGHADYSTTANIYTHMDINSLRNAIEKI